VSKQRSVLVFNGIDDHLELSKGFSHIDHSITIAFWAKGQNSLNQETSLLEAYNSDQTRVLHISLPWGEANHSSVLWDAGNEEGFDRIEKKVKLKDYNNWTHWAFVKNAITGKMFIYRNGIVWHRGYAHNRSLTGIEKVTIGAAVNLTNYWKGYLTELSIWSQERSQEDIKKIINQYPLGDEIDLVTYLPLNGDHLDQTSYHNSAILFGTSWSLDTLPPPKTTTSQSKTRSKSKSKRSSKRMTIINEVFNSLETEELKQPVDQVEENIPVQELPESDISEQNQPELLNQDNQDLNPESDIFEQNQPELLNQENQELNPESDIFEQDQPELLNQDNQELNPESDISEQNQPELLNQENQDLNLESNISENLATPETTSISETDQAISETTIFEAINHPESIKKKRLIVGCDGIWNEEATCYPTNVLKFANAIKHIAEDQTPQIIFLSGYGTTEDDDFIKRLGSETLGWGLDYLIQNAYRFLCLNYDPETEDEIYLIGFSRGAYIVRCLASFIDKCGLLKRSQIRKIKEAYQLYRDPKIDSNDTQLQQFRQENCQNINTEKEALKNRISIKMLGCWDTVGALGIPDLTPWFPLASFYHQKYQFLNCKISPIIENAFHAVAIDEKRKQFPSTPMQTNPKNPDQILKEVLFAGDHHCLGGGFKETQGLADYPLQWMINQAQKLGLEFNPTEYEAEEFQIKLEPTIQFDNNVKGLYNFIGQEWRSFKTSTVTVHHSVVKRLNACPNYRPQNLKPFFKDLIENQTEN
jgi:uncharacterized protein (DUF2235 family)